MSDRKKIMVFIDWYFPAYKAGGPVQSCLNLISRLHRDYDFMVVTSDHEYMETEPMQGITRDAWKRGKYGEQVIYLSAPSPTVIGDLLKRENPDIIWLNSMFSNSFSIIPMRLWKGKTLLSPRGMLAPEALKIKKLKKKIYLKLSAALGWHKDVVFHATNENESEQIRHWFPSNRVVVAPNFPTFQTSVAREHRKSSGELKLVMLARIAPEKNNLVAIELLKKWNPKGKVILDLYGSEYDPDYASRCREMCLVLPPSVTVSFKGSVEPEKVPSILAAYDFLFFPTRGENYGHAIVQSWNAGTPVIISDTTPWKDLQAASLGWELSLSDPTSWIKVLNTCLQMGHEEHAALSSACLAHASQLQHDAHVLVLNQNLFR